MATVIKVEQMEFVDQIFATAKRLRNDVEESNKNGERQINFPNKSLTAEHVRWIYQDIVRKKCVYRRRDLENLLGGSRPCAASPFFNLCIEAGFASESGETGELIYKFDF